MYLLGYDIGSSSVKASLIEALTGRVVASDFFPKDEAPIKALEAGWAEQNPDDWWDRVKSATASVMAKSGVDKADVRAIGISYQMHGLVCVDRQGHPLRDAIIWCDSRAVGIGNRAFEQIGPERCLSRLLNSPGNFTASKLMWVKTHEPEVYEKIYKILLPGDYIAWRLTGNMLTTPEGLSECILWDFSNDCPARFVLDYFGFDESVLPEVIPTFSDQGHLTAEAATELGLSVDTRVTYRGGDQPNNALSLGVLSPGQIASTAGTSGVVYGINGSYGYDTKSRVNSFVHVNHKATDPRVGILLCVNGTGILNSWVKRNVAPPGMSYQMINEEASRIPVGSEGVAILPFGNGAERVLENRDAGCSIHGINFNLHRREHLYRAAQEGIAFSLAYGIGIMEDMGMNVSTIHAGHANMYLSTIFRDTIASVTGATIRLFDTDGAAGAAKGAGIGIGFYKSAEEAFDSLRVIDTIYPASDREPYLAAYSRWKKILNN